ncbi:MAG: hypothetical protein B7Y35_06170 [Sphingomonadales bacterium 28-64-96]|nr:MAG: hypothetical protein B7Y35_06170 [Sphingomonadales bacterium 28-64-96]
MIMRAIIQIAATLLLLASAASAALGATVTSCAAIPAALAAALPGDVISTGPITCTAPVVISKVNAGGVTIDATGAQLQQGMAVIASSGITFKGGTYGMRQRDTAARYAIAINGGSHISFAGATVLGGPVSLTATGAFATGDRGGLQARGGQFITVRDSRFIGFRTALMFYQVADSLIARNHFTEASSDGINVVGSYRVIVAGNYARWEKRIGKAHPDGIQLWSLPNFPLQSDIWVINNATIGMMQGILSSDPKTEPGSGTRLHFHGNYCPVVFSHTITCGLCTNSVATDNVLASYPGSLFGIGKIKGFETVRGNVVARNVMLDGTKALPPRTWWYGKVPLEGKVGSAYDLRALMASTITGAVP